MWYYIGFWNGKPEVFLNCKPFHFRAQKREKVRKRNERNWEKKERKKDMSSKKSVRIERKEGLEKKT